MEVKVYTTNETFTFQIDQQYSEYELQLANIAKEYAINNGISWNEIVLIKYNNITLYRKINC